MAPKINSYVVGFLILTGSVGGPHVALIEKNRPDWQKGYLNGIGGHIEPNESPLGAMVREFYEECKLEAVETNWQQFAKLHGTDLGGVPWEVYFFHNTRPSGKWCWSENYGKTDEAVRIHRCEPLPKNVIPNLKFLIPMALWQAANPEDNGYTSKVMFDITEVAF